VFDQASVGRAAVDHLAARGHDRILALMNNISVGWHLLGTCRMGDDPGAVVDRQLRYQTANGPFWHRASFDGYGEKRDGSQWEPVPPGSRLTLGRGWPLLTGERGEYRLAAGRAAQLYLDTMARAGDNTTFLIAEQVWDHRPPADDDPRFRPGENTFSATPLACPADWEPIDEDDDRQRCYGSANRNSFFGAGMVNAARAAAL
jgi:hypothetical protein